MDFQVHQLPAPLDQYLESVFHYKNFEPDHSIERVVPTGHLFIIFELDGMERYTYDPKTLKPNASFTKVWISGMHQHYLSISAHQKSEMFVMQFKAFGAHPFFHQPVKELNERVVAAEHILGDEILTLREALLAPETVAEKFTVAEQWLHQRFDADKTPPAELLTMVEALQQAPATDYAKVLDSYPHTQKHLIEQFKQYVGLTPKYYQRILRFNEILQQIRAKEVLKWADVAYQCGYSDQSHFIKEFKHFSGFNPQEFIQQDFQQDEPNFFPLDR